MPAPTAVPSVPRRPTRCASSASRLSCEPGLTGEHNDLPLRRGRPASGRHCPTLVPRPNSRGRGGEPVESVRSRACARTVCRAGPHAQFGTENLGEVTGGRERRRPCPPPRRGRFEQEAMRCLVHGSAGTVAAQPSRLRRPPWDSAAAAASASSPAVGPPVRLARLVGPVPSSTRTATRRRHRRISVEHVDPDARHFKKPRKKQTTGRARHLRTRNPRLPDRPTLRRLAPRLPIVRRAGRAEAATGCWMSFLRSVRHPIRSPRPLAVLSRLTFPSFYLLFPSHPSFYSYFFSICIPLSSA